MNQRRQKKWKLRRLYLSLLISGIYMALMGIIGPAYAGEPPTEPLLRIETGMHTASILRMDVDANERYVVTASLDKTVRVWSLEDGRLLQVLRLPLAEGSEGKVYAVAISPDGETIAASGWTGRERDSTFSIYLFERQSGQIIRRLDGLPNVIFHLSYSPDGNRLAATLGKNGIRVWDTSNYEQTGEDKAYGDKSYSADFDSDGRLVTSSLDGYIRLYDTSLKLLAKREAPGGKKPFGVAFSSDGRKVAVGYSGSTAVSVLSGQNLELDYVPDTAGIDNGNLITVSWSRDGTRLYAGGTYRKSNSPIVRWDNAGRGKRQILNASQNTVMGLHPLTGNRLVWASQGPAFGLLDSKGQSLYTQHAEIADYRGLDDQFLVSSEGTTESNQNK